MDPVSLLSKIAQRAAELSCMNVPQLRYLHPDNYDNCGKFIATKRDCIESILFEEFSDDYEALNVQLQGIDKQHDRPQRRDTHDSRETSKATNHRPQYD